MIDRLVGMEVGNHSHRWLPITVIFYLCVHALTRPIYTMMMVMMAMMSMLMSVIVMMMAMTRGGGDDIVALIGRTGFGFVSVGLCNVLGTTRLHYTQYSTYIRPYESTASNV